MNEMPPKPKLKRPDNFQLYTDSNGNAELRVAFRRENIPYLAKVLKVVDRMMATDERFDEAALAKPPSEEEHPNA